MWPVKPIETGTVMRAIQIKLTQHLINSTHFIIKMA